MDREVYEVIRDRFHLYDPRQYILQGTWPKDAEMKAYLDRKPLQARIEKIEIVSAMERFKDPDRIRGERITATVFFPESLPDSGLLEIYAQSGEKRRLWYRVNVKCLKKKQGLPQFYVEEDRVTAALVRIRGWVIGTEETGIEILSENGTSLPAEIQRTVRADVEQMFEEAVDPGRTGFFIEMQRPAGSRAVLVFSCGAKKAEYAVSLGTVKRTQERISTLFFKGTHFLKTKGPAALGKKVIDRTLHASDREIPYEKWLPRHLASPAELKAQRSRRWQDPPLISVVVPLYRTPEAFLNALVESIRQQTYSNWELILSDGSGDHSPLESLLKELEAGDGRIHVLTHHQALRIAQNTNEALKAAAGDWIVFADHDDVLTPDALYEIAIKAEAAPEAEMIYSDEDKMSLDGHKFFQPHFKPDYNSHLLCSVNYICHLLAMRVSLVRKLAGPSGTDVLRPEFEGAQDYDLVLRAVEMLKPDQILHIPRILYHWRAHGESTAENPESKSYAFEAGRLALQEHYKRTGIDCVVSHGEFPGLYRTRFLRKSDPLVSIIIPNKDHIQDLKRCMDSIDDLSTYRNYEYIIVENNSEEKETFDFYETEKARRQKDPSLPPFRAVVWKEGFNFSAINNFGASAASGEYLLLLNNDTQMINPDCLEEMLGICMEPGVGAVGARLYYEDDTIQHAGVVIGFGGIAGHCFVMQPRGTTGYMHRIICTQEYSAVTAACMMVRREAFEQAGGLSPELAVAFNDIDFCLKLRSHGWLVVYAAYAELYHFESKSRGLEDTPDKIARFNREMAVFEKRWPDILRNGDPYYNPNLTLKSQDFSLRRI